MIINLDKFFVAELNEQGFEMSYKKVVEIYRASRQRPKYIEHKSKKHEESKQLQKIIKDFNL